ncbi:MAG: nitroreductase family deazaflavin-dependent oxidoreductase [Anaerolineales bacterium]
MNINKIFQNTIKKISSTKLGAQILARILPPLDRWWFRTFSTKSTLTGIILGFPMVMVTTIGAKSGLPRTTPLLYIRDEENPATFALIATNFGQEKYPAWYFNLKANPRATCTLNGITQQYLAREITGEEYQHYWNLATNTYFGYQLYRQRIHTRPIPILLLEPIESPYEAD